jgi:DNA polymerase-3 subunit epsilon
VSLKKIILGSVSHDRLKELSNYFDAKSLDMRSSDNIRAAINRIPKLTEQDLIVRLKVDELKTLCNSCGVSPIGKRSELIHNLLKKHEKPPIEAKHDNSADRFVAIDFETADYPRDSACAVALVTVQGKRILDRSSFLIKPPRKIFSLSKIHGISWKDVANAQTFEEIWPEILAKIEAVNFLVAHNASFDRSVLKACCKAYSLALPEKTFECTVHWAKQVWNLRPTKLPDVCRFLGIQLDHHDPLSDAEACAKIMIKIRQETADRR